MNIGINASASGMNAAAVNQRVTANNIANINTPSYTAKSTVQTEVFPAGTRVANLRDDTSLTNDLNKQMTDLENNKNFYSANAKAFKVQSRMAGEVINLVG